VSALALWSALVPAVLLAAAVAALSGRPDRRASATATTVAGTGALLLLLGSDLVALVWLATAGPAALLPGLRRRSSAAVLPAAPLALVGVLAALLLAALYRVCVQVDWRALPAGPPVAATAATAGRLLTADVVLLLGASLLLTAVLLVAARREAP